MTAKSLLNSFGIVAVVLAATGFGACAADDLARGRFDEIIKSRPVTASNNSQKYRPKPGCFATGTRDSSGNSQTAC
jgi:hypothetical protein